MALASFPVAREQQVLLTVVRWLSHWRNRLRCATRIVAILVVETNIARQTSLPTVLNSPVNGGQNSITNTPSNPSTAVSLPTNFPNNAISMEALGAIVQFQSKLVDAERVHEKVVEGHEEWIRFLLEGVVVCSGAIFAYFGYQDLKEQREHRSALKSEATDTANQIFREVFAKKFDNI